VRHDAGLPVEREVAAADRQPPHAPLGPFARVLDRANRAMLVVGMIALVLASFILTFSVASRYLFKMGTDWQDEAAVFCIVGTVFLCGGYVQANRGHVGIEAISSLLSPAVNRVRMFVVDVLTLMFCSFFAWKSWTLWHEAWVDRMTTSSTWAPPLAIPYGLMATGMTLLALQVLLQVLAHFSSATRR
jgi:TRAP-type C4-dicarboxylate transport system permease small subunit